MAMIGQGTWPLKAAANAIGKLGWLAMLKNGYVIQGQETTGARAIGTFACEFDNTGGSNGKPITVNPGSKDRWEQFQNSTSGDAITQADVGNWCYATSDPFRVAKTDGSSTRSKAGLIMGFDGNGCVLVCINPFA
jgi:hypothetical protein